MEKLAEGAFLSCVGVQRESRAEPLFDRKGVRSSSLCRILSTTVGGPTLEVFLFPVWALTRQQVDVLVEAEFALNAATCISFKLLKLVMMDHRDQHLHFHGTQTTSIVCLSYQWWQLHSKLLFSGSFHIGKTTADSQSA